jgi:hypothetical protein
MAALPLCAVTLLSITHRLKQPLLISSHASQLVCQVLHLTAMHTQKHCRLAYLKPMLCHLRIQVPTLLCCP